MADVICLMGDTGSGKTFTIKTLDPSKVFYFDCDKKGMSWVGWRKHYNSANKNYFAVSSIPVIKDVLSKINTSQLHIKVVVIDTINGIMLDDEMSRRKEKGFDKWMDLAANVYELIRDAHSYRDDLCVVFTAHIQDDTDDCGNHYYHILTNGKKLEKIKLESKFSTVLFARCVDGKYFLETQAKNSTAKSQYGMFDFEIPNDLNFIVNRINECNS